MIKGEQIAALPLHWDRNGDLKVLMVTSRDTGRWVMPKGWQMDGLKPWAAAEIEALEEAGAKGRISCNELGVYHYDKLLEGGNVLPCSVRVYPMIVDKLKRNWKERGERKRRWFSPEAAAARVHEPELSELLLSLSDKPRRQPIIRQLLKS
ncbi:NUDIX domain-containing protein [Citreicella sp. C3M06]|uniref:NUDIX hydrolase n=1 Tax=Citreicella sp. C3M06 TaxID=2841564 RepID=UPI001C0963C2|nr:NUDIX domain-containing protein [Citreicella sp. C3M06]MBU2959766.1 NUDIX domain-containing protein [Citreicella sp. C3M06]